MDLKFPQSDIDFIITPAYFLGDFDVYDREESLGEYLSKFNPNNFEDLSLILEEKFFNGGRVLGLSLFLNYSSFCLLTIFASSSRSFYLRL